MAQINNIVLGYACINETYRYMYSCNHSTTEKVLQKLSPEDAAGRCMYLAQQNLEALQALVSLNNMYGVRFFRITSELFPHCGNPRMAEYAPDEAYFRGDISFAYDQLSTIGELVKEHGHRVGFHSSPYNQLGTPKDDVWQGTLVDLQLYYRTMVHMNLDPMHCVVYHVGGVYGDKRATMDRWAERYHAMDEHLRNLIILENDEHYYDAEMVLQFCEQHGVPMVFDFHHNTQSLTPATIDSAFLDRVCATWDASPLDPKFHLSEQKPDARRGAHSDYVEAVPQVMLDYAATHPDRLYWIMLEAKCKEKALFHLLDNYGVTHTFVP